ncbi:hypothetical protein VH13_06380 [Corynebacterium ulcerans]|nr:hypothetical protein VH13_06380 [Corynebacterium ulcerans]
MIVVFENARGDLCVKRQVEFSSVLKNDKRAMLSRVRQWKCRFGVLRMGCRRLCVKSKSKTFPLVASWFASIELVGRIKPASQAGLEVKIRMMASQANLGCASR